MTAFVHLRAHSAYSMLEGTILPKALPALAAGMGQPAIALTDRAGLFGAMEFTEAARKAGVQPVIGALLGVDEHWLAILAQDERGYLNLMALISDAYRLGAERGQPSLPLPALAGRTDGLIALTAGPEGALTQWLAAGQRDRADALADEMAALFPGRLYIELSRQGDAAQAAAEPHLIELADARGLPLVATNPFTYATPAGHAAHDVLLCIADGAYVGSSERRRSNPHHWAKPPATMAELFADLPDAVANTVVVAQRCAVAAPERKPILPHLEGNLREAARAGLAERLARSSPSFAWRRRPPQAVEGAAVSAAGDAAAPLHYASHGPSSRTEEDHWSRLDYELGVIERMGFSGYFLIVADFIQWAKRHGIPVGPGRGSGAGSVVAWALGITDLDPLAHGLLFERFLNPERVSMPDFDIDFCETRRDEVILYVADRYGHDRVAQIITFGTLKARAVVKDVGRVLQMPYGQVDRLAKLIPNHPSDPWTLKRALEGVPDLRSERDRDPAVARLFDIGLQLEGLPRHASTHAAGVVIGDRPLHQLVPLYRDPRSDMGVTQFDMKWVERAGLVKFDFLGLKTLSVLELARTLLLARGVAVDWLTLPLDDEAAYKLMARGDTVGVFQLESEGMRRTLAQVKPDRFEDVVALVALYRPGPMDNIPSFAARKHGREAVALPHPALHTVLAETYGLIVYQEQVMQAAQVLAGFSLGEADLLRRAMGKKKKDEMAAQRARFLKGCAQNAIGETKANELFDLIDKFAGYGFNKSHAAAYALLAYHTAWLKAHHPVEFYTASMQYDCHLTDKLAVFVEDAKRLAVSVLGPCVARSAPGFTVEDGAVRYALAGLKGVGEAAMVDVVAARPFRSLSDFAARIDPKSLNKRMLEALAAAGAFDVLEPNRAAVHGMADTLIAAAQSAAAARSCGQGTLLGDAIGDVQLLVPRAGAQWSQQERVAREKDAFGFYFSGHPIDQFAPVLRSEGARSWADICAAGRGGPEQVKIGTLVGGARWMQSRNGSGRRYLLVDCSDASGSFVARAFDDEPQAALEKLAKSGEPALLTAEPSWREGETGPALTIRSAVRLADAAKRLRVRVELKIERVDAIPKLASILADRRGGRGELIARVELPGGVASVRLGGDFLADQELLPRLMAIGGVELLAGAA
ncbi:MAG: DNA polymerase III subunit alpha [Sphingomonadaceae bacterium]|nr:DNA polymerase III subunit alpha [Sphingomonadaceae bacterium]